MAKQQLKPRVNTQTGRIEGGYYNGLTPSEADELYQGLHEDYREREKQKQVNYVAGKTREGINKAGRVLQNVADFTPLGVVDNIVQSQVAFDKGQYGKAAENFGYAALEVLPLGGVRKALSESIIRPASNIINQGILNRATKAIKKSLKQEYSDPRFLQRVGDMASTERSIEPEFVNMVMELPNGKILEYKSPVGGFQSSFDPGLIKSSAEDILQNKNKKLFSQKLPNNYLGVYEYENLKSSVDVPKVFKSNAYNFVQNLRKGNIKNFTDLKNYNPFNKTLYTGLHEVEGHGLTHGALNLPNSFTDPIEKISKDVQKSLDEWGTSQKSKDYIKYLLEPTEVRARFSEMREARKRLTGKSYWDPLTNENYNEAVGEAINSGVDDTFFRSIESVENGKDKFIDLYNKMFVPAAATAVGTTAAINNKRLGGIIYKKGGRVLKMTKFQQGNKFDASGLFSQGWENSNQIYGREIPEQDRIPTQMFREDFFTNASPEYTQKISQYPGWQQGKGWGDFIKEHGLDPNIPQERFQKYSHLLRDERSMPGTLARFVGSAMRQEGGSLSMQEGEKIEYKWSGTQLEPEDEEAFIKWHGNEPIPEDYDSRGFWWTEKKLGRLKPTLEDYYKEDPNYHAYSIGYDGRILKNPNHPTFNLTKQAEDEMNSVIAWRKSDGRLVSVPKEKLNKDDYTPMKFQKGGSAPKQQERTPLFSELPVMPLEIDGEIIDVYIAQDEDTRKNGLSEIEAMDEDEGMLFIFPTPKNHTMWMKDTKIPLDMIFMDQSGLIRNIVQGIPDSEELIGGGDDIKYVLELASGVASKMDVQPGDQIDVDEQYQKAVDEGTIKPMKVLDEEGNVQMEIEGGERIFSRKSTQAIVDKITKIGSLDQNGEEVLKLMEDLGKYIAKEIIKQDEREPEFTDEEETVIYKKNGDTVQKKEI